jgi:transcriptional regulator with GAF, ATPase, and Fis domain/serine/threonine protein kinase
MRLLGSAWWLTSIERQGVAHAVRVVRHWAFPMTLLFGRYEYVRELGAGATGRVLWVYDRAEANAPRAVKVVPAERATLLAWEFAKLRSVQHPCLARVHELLTLETAVPELGLARGSVLLVEDLVSGARWGSFARGLGADREQVLFRSALCVTEALCAVHDAGLVHGDVKPDNVLVHGEHGEAVLVDFGFARAPGMTPLRGTPRYMAPEMFLGMLTQAADVYALGVALYELAGGESVSAHASKPLPALSSLSSAFMELIALFTEQSAEKRPSDAREALSALLLLGKKLAFPLPARGERYALTRPARAPDVMARRALTLPFVPYGGAVERLVEELDAHELVILRGPSQSGRTRLAHEALKRCHEQRLARDAAPFTCMQGLAALNALESERVLVLLDDAELSDLSEAGRAIHAARLLGRSVRVLAVGDLTLTADEAHVLDLPALDARELATFLERLFDRKGIGTELLQAVRARTGAFAGRVCQLAARALALGLEPDDPDALPDFAANVKLARLSPQAQRLGFAAAWAPRVLSAPRLAQALLESCARADEAFAELVTAGVLAWAPSAMLAAHVARTLRTHTPSSERERLQRWLSALPAPHTAFELVLRGELELAAQAFVREARVLRGEQRSEHARALLEEALALCADSALRLELADLERASAHYAQAARLLHGESAPEAIFLHADVLRLLGDRAASERELTHIAPDSPLFARAQALRARLLYDRGALDQALELARELEQAQDGEAQVRAQEVRTLVALAHGEHAEDSAERTLTLARTLGSPRFVARALGLRSQCFTLLGQRARALADAREAVLLARSQGEMHEAVTFALNRGLLEFESALLGQALEALDEAAYRLCLIDRPADLVRVLYNLGNVALFVGDYARAEVVLREAVGRLAQHADVAALTLAKLALAELHLVRGEVDEALATLEDALAHCPEHFRSLCVQILARKSVVLLAKDALDQAQAAVLRAEALGPLDDSTAHVELVLARVRVALARGEAGDAEREARAALVELYERLPAPERLRLLFASVDAARAAGEERAAAERVMLARALLEQMLLGLSPRLRARMRALPAHARVLETSAGERVAEEPLLSAERFRALLRGARRLLAEESRARLSQRAAELLLELVHAERALVIVGREADAQLHVLGRADLTASPHVDRSSRRSSHDVAPYSVAFSRSVVERALLEQAPVVTLEAQSDVRFDTAESLHALHVRSVLCVPLRGADTRAVLYLDDRVRGAAFTADDVALVEDLALLLAQAFHLLAQRKRDEQRARRAEHTRDALRAELEAAQATQRKDAPFVYASAAMARVVELSKRVAASDVPLLILGESGTGKELIARFVHASSARSTGPFVAESCAALPDTLLESALFGHVRGAFTGAERAKKGLFELAEGGTLLLDEVGEMSPALQAKLLRVLQESEVRPLGSERTRRVNVRILAATHRDLLSLVQAGKFREDLYYRLAVVSLDVPPLRARREDIAVLVQHFVHKHGEGRRISVSADVLRALEHAAWPGNVRELENQVRRALALCDTRIEIAHLGFTQAQPVLDDELDLHAQTELLTRTLVEQALSRAQGNLTRAAELLGISRFGLQKMVKRFGLGPYKRAQRK